jgi:DNA-binding GntR family transcriptional regulator
MMATAKRSRGSAQERLAPYEMLKRAILSGELAPGQPLVETPLAEWCGVSRTPIREALTRLEQDGLVHHSDGGLVVRVRSPEEILDIYDTRIVLEAKVGKVAAERRTDHDVRMLSYALQRGRETDASDSSAMVEANELFHRMVWRASHNEALVDLLQRLNLHLGRYPETTLVAPGRWAEAIGEHADLAEAIEQRRGDAAYDIAQRHFERARDIRLALFAESAFDDA